MRVKDSGIICRGAVVLILCACPATGTIYLNDGLTHDIDYETNDSVRVDDQTPGMYTTVNWLDGGIMNSPDWLIALEDSRINILGGYINDRLYVAENSIATINNGYVNYLTAAGNSTLNVNGGKIKGIGTYTTSTTIINNGLITQTDLFWEL